MPASRGKRAPESCHAECTYLFWITQTNIRQSCFYNAVFNTGYVLVMVQSTKSMWEDARGEQTTHVVVAGPDAHAYHLRPD